uniref:Uncharacterized protein n=1 Tax=Anguilla anguilla TaxID=7936 RepID=A0A0E9SW08_ANGAN
MHIHFMRTQTNFEIHSIEYVYILTNMFISWILTFATF